MALAPCRECGAEVSKTAKKCPQCGVDHPANKVAAFGQNVTRIGCALTILITLPFILMMCLAAS